MTDSKTARTNSRYKGTCSNCGGLLAFQLTNNRRRSIHWVRCGESELLEEGESDGCGKINCLQLFETTPAGNSKDPEEANA